MPAGTGGIIGGVAILLIAAVALLTQTAPSGSAASVAILIVVSIQITGALLFFLRNRPVRFRATAVTAALALLIAAMFMLDLNARSVGLAVAGGCHAVAYLSLLTWFAASLRRNREPVVTGLARRVRNTMPDKVVHYTRHVTLAWCIFFAAQLLLSVGLLLLAPQAIWSAFVNVLNLPLLVAMFLAEFGCRMVLFRHEPRTGLIETLSAMRRGRLSSVSRP